MTKAFTQLIAIKGSFFVALLMMNSLWACSAPKNTASVDPVEQPETAAPLQNTVDKTKCNTWGSDSVETIKNLSLYKEFYKQDNYEEAMKYWRYVFKNAPGVKEYPLIDGIAMYKSFIDKTTDTKQKELFADSLFMVYDQRIACFGETGDLLGRKAIDMARYQPEALEATIKTFERAMELDKNKSAYYLLSPYMTMLVRALQKDVATKERLLDQYTYVADIIDFNVKADAAKGKKYAEQQEVIDDLLSKVDGLFSCETLVPILDKQYKANPEDPKVWARIFTQLRAAKCYDEPLFIEATEKYNKVEPTAAKSYFLAKSYMGKNNYTKALDFYKMAAETAETNSEKADYYLEMAQVYRKLDDFPTSRTMAQKAASIKPGWGDPYIHIGDLYASSGPKCGSGTGFESQVVTWVAIDMYEKAKSVDGSIAAKANQKIANYRQYMPSQGECFFRQLNEGDSFTVGCWINETTTVRCAKEK